MLHCEAADDERERQDERDMEKSGFMIKPGYNGRECDYEQGRSETESDVNPEERGNLGVSNM